MLAGEDEGGDQTDVVLGLIVLIYLINFHVTLWGHCHNWLCSGDTSGSVLSNNSE